MADAAAYPHERDDRLRELLYPDRVADETAYLLSSRANAEHLHRSIGQLRGDRDLEEGARVWYVLLNYRTGPDTRQLINDDDLIDAIGGSIPDANRGDIYCDVISGFCALTIRVDAVDSVVALNHALYYAGFATTALGVLPGLQQVYTEDEYRRRFHDAQPGRTLPDLGLQEGE